MSSDLDTQLREYSRRMDQEQGALSVEDILERSGELQVVPEIRSRHHSPRGRSVKTPAPGPGRGLTWAVAAFVVILALGGVYLALSGHSDELVNQTTIPTPTTSPTTVPNPTRAEDAVVHGWPTTTENPAGVYSWDGDRCAGESCSIGVMHNGYGSGDVEIQFHRTGSEPIADEGATAVTVAGHDAVYQRINEQAEKWTVDINGKMISITITAEPGTSQADLDEAHAIIDSIRTEPSDNSLGARLIFTLTTDDWDSG